jgi:hypothetical protein
MTMPSKRWLFLLKISGYQLLPQSFVTSAEKNTGREEMLDIIQLCNEQNRDQIKAGN